jgi:hypothetical protein
VLVVLQAAPQVRRRVAACARLLLLLLQVLLLYEQLLRQQGYLRAQQRLGSVTAAMGRGGMAAWRRRKPAACREAAAAVGVAAVGIVGCCVAALLNGSHKLLCHLLDGASWRCAATLKLHRLPAAAKLLRRLASHWELQGV